MPVKKQWIRCGDEPLWLFAAKQFERVCLFDRVVVVADEREIPYMRNFADYTFVPGGKERQDSLKNGLNATDSKYVLTADVARCCIDAECVKRVVDLAFEYDCIAPVIEVVDTTLLNDEWIDRQQVRLVQTPQLSNRELLLSAIEGDKLHTDDSTAMKSAGYRVTYVEGSKTQIKLTKKSDLSLFGCLIPPLSEQFTGIGFDTHSFEEGKPCVLGGVSIEGCDGFRAHSDGDVLLHSLIDAILGAAAIGDIGELFPDSDMRYSGIDSKHLFEEVFRFVSSVGFELVNLDITVIAEKPRLKNIKKDIQKNLSILSSLPLHRICVKATTAEKMGFVGRGEGVAVLSVANLKFYNWKES